jgi:hypothetical protein
MKRSFNQAKSRLMRRHGRVSGVQVVRRYSSGRIKYRAMYVQIGNPVVSSIDRT